MICRFYPIAYYIYVFGQCLVDFSFIAVERPFEITEIFWRSDTELESCLELRLPCISMKIIVHNLSANQIQAFAVYGCIKS